MTNQEYLRLLSKVLNTSSLNTEWKDWIINCVTIEINDSENNQIIKIKVCDIPE